MVLVSIGERDYIVVSIVCSDTGTWCTVEHWTTLFSLYIGTWRTELNAPIQQLAVSRPPAPLTGTILYACLISNISSIVLNMGIGQRMLREKVTQVNEYMRSKRLPVDIRDKVFESFLYGYAALHKSTCMPLIHPGP